MSAITTIVMEGRGTAGQSRPGHDLGGHRTTIRSVGLSAKHRCRRTAGAHGANPYSGVSCTSRGRSRRGRYRVSTTTWRTRSAQRAMPRVHLQRWHAIGVLEIYHHPLTIVRAMLEPSNQDQPIFGLKATAAALKSRSETPRSALKIDSRGLPDARVLAELSRQPRRRRHRDPLCRVSASRRRQRARCA